MIRTYKLKHHANKSKEKKILEIFPEYRQAAKLLAKEQWKLFYSTGKLNKDHRINITSNLSARFLQTCQYQVVSILNSYVSNLQNRFIEVICQSSLDENTRIKLFYINKYKKYFSKQVKMRKEIIDEDILLLSRKIFHKLSKNKPTFKNINLALDSKVAKIKTNDGSSDYDYWIQFSTLDKGKTLFIPIESNSYFENKTGELKNFVQVNLNRKKHFSISFMKEMEKQDYIPLTPKISIDIGLKVLFATHNGDLLGRKFYSKLSYYDNLAVKLQKELQKQGIRLRDNERYNNLITIKRNYIKNEINKALNRLIEVYSPKEIILENLNFHNPKLSKKTNRLIRTFGKRIIESKLKSFNEEFGIIITKINCAYTSQECNSCGYVDKANRKSQSDFLCKSCGNTKNADVNAAKNILARSSCKELANIYISKKIILDKLITRFIERKISLNSKAKDVIFKNPYFKDYVQNNLLCNICV